MNETTEQAPTRRQTDRKGYDVINAERIEGYRNWIDSMLEEAKSGTRTFEDISKKLQLP